METDTASEWNTDTDETSCGMEWGQMQHQNGIQTSCGMEWRQIQHQNGIQTQIRNGLGTWRYIGTDLVLGMGCHAIGAYSCMKNLSSIGKINRSSKTQREKKNVITATYTGATPIQVPHPLVPRPPLSMLSSSSGLSRLGTCVTGTCSEVTTTWVLLPMW